MFFSLLKMDFRRVKPELENSREFRKSIKRFFQICDTDDDDFVTFAEYDNCNKRYDDALSKEFPEIYKNHQDFLTEEVKVGIQNFLDTNNDKKFTAKELAGSYYYITRKFLEIYLHHTSANRDGWLLNEIQRIFEAFTVPDNFDIEKHVPIYRFVPMSFKIVLNSNSRFRLNRLVSRIDPNNDGALDPAELTNFFLKITDNFSKIMKKFL
ncbi:Oidioi.mRNA.OKI2018_I69.chr2.g4916.t1.cds [Oikopleura dioica]|uniref:Oidioi.mRNA.OKI2018_I69.chr2.g4916.t1.cds n=1 Tax=Oikopleura dioica TaxID=34765 RepID=A0ABN7T336_OIKDI|nr:Oidioi.mRNA.OKI2018_I69.chr2.g4916.t1.cds [Oikopleura dioica]